MIITDFIKTLPKTSNSPYVKHAEERAVQTRTVMKALEGLPIEGKLRDAVYQTAGAVRDAFDKARLEALQDGAALPLALRESPRINAARQSSMSVAWQPDFITKLSDTPLVDLSELRTIADTLGFVIIPHQYLNPAARQAAQKYVGNGLEEFIDGCENNGMQVYVLGPVEAYSLEAHVRRGSKSPDGKYEALDGAPEFGMYIPVQISQAFMAIRMAVPMFRSVLREIGNVAKRVGDVAKRVGDVERDMKTMQEQLRQIEQQVAELRRQEAIRRVEEARRAELERASRESFWANEPLAFALPAGGDITLPGRAWLGPCWGEDFADIFCAAMGLKLVSGQRQAIHGLWNMPQQSAIEVIDTPLGALKKRRRKVTAESYYEGEGERRKGFELVGTEPNGTLITKHIYNSRVRAGRMPYGASGVGEVIQAQPGYVLRCERCFMHAKQVTAFAWFCEMCDAIE